MIHNKGKTFEVKQTLQGVTAAVCLQSINNVINHFDRDYTP